MMAYSVLREPQIGVATKRRSLPRPALRPLTATLPKRTGERKPCFASQFSKRMVPQDFA